MNKLDLMEGDDWASYDSKPQWWEYLEGDDWASDSFGAGAVKCIVPRNVRRRREIEGANERPA